MFSTQLYVPCLIYKDSICKNIMCDDSDIQPNLVKPNSALVEICNFAFLRIHPLVDILQVPSYQILA
jgi:hypothetical protein